jgi:rod shape-determining protein MreC
MPRFWFSRARVIALLTLTSIVLITLDVRDSPVLDKARTVFGKLFTPVESGARTVTRPFVNAWHGITDYSEVRDENRRLHDLIAKQQGAQIAAEASIREGQELLALNGLPNLAGIDSVSAQVVGESSLNYSQTIEINKGSSSGLKVGMPVLNAAGLVGKITEVSENRSLVMLITDPSFTIAVKIVAPYNSDTTDTTTTTTQPVVTTESIPGFIPNETAYTTTTLAGQTTVVTVPSEIDGIQWRESGALEGRGPGGDPVVRFIEDSTRFGQIQVGSRVMTAGGAFSIAPPGIVVGTVSRVEERGGTLGPILHVRLTAEVTNLNFLRILLYQPSTEIPSK